mgnify:CR=1 FL=1
MHHDSSLKEQVSQRTQKNNNYLSSNPISWLQQAVSATMDGMGLGPTDKISFSTIISYRDQLQNEFDTKVKEGLKEAGLDENKNIVDKIITDELGYAKTKELPIGKYYIRETKTSMHYKVLSDELEVELVEDNQKATVNVLNENAYYEDKLPVTGR